LRRRMVVANRKTSFGKAIFSFSMRPPHPVEERERDTW
jgi:hypothetical protein